MTPLVQTAGWTLVHFVWQGVLIAIVTGVILEFLAFRSARARYLVACLGLLAMLAAPALTLALASGSGASSPLTATDIGSSSIDRYQFRAWPVLKPASPGETALDARAGGDTLLAGIVGMWAAGVSLLLIRMAGGWWRVRRLHRLALASELSAWQPVCDRIAASLTVKTIVRVAESALVETPSVVGWLQPVILLPVSALSGLTPAQVEAILAHELAHIRRHDFAINLLQSIAETLLFYHPAVWWMSARIRAEREYCCDDVAVAFSGDALNYASALAELETRRSVMVLAASGGSLLDRVGRLLRVPADDGAQTTGWLVTLVLTMLFVAGPAWSSGCPIRSGTRRPRRNHRPRLALPDPLRRRHPQPLSRRRLRSLQRLLPGRLRRVQPTVTASAFACATRTFGCAGKAAGARAKSAAGGTCR